MTDDKTIVKTAPVLLGPKNCEAATGLSWRWVRDAARELGVPFLCAKRKCAIRTEAFMAALERLNSAPDAPLTTDEPMTDPAALVRQLLGKRRRTA